MEKAINEMKEFDAIKQIQTLVSNAKFAATRRNKSNKFKIDRIHNQKQLVQAFLTHPCMRIQAIATKAISSIEDYAKNLESVPA